MRERGTFSAMRDAAVVLWILPVLFLLASSHLSSRILQERAAASSAGRTGETRMTLLFEVSRHPEFSFGFRNFLGDLAWLSAVQTAGALRMAPRDYDRLYLQLLAATNFDRRFDVPYFLGGIILGESTKHVREALDILQRGWETHPDKWRFPFYIGYIHYFSLGDPIAGARSLEDASGIAGSPGYLSLLAARMYSEGRAPETALAFLERMIRQEADPKRVEMLQGRVRDVIVERDIQAMERAVGEYRARTGALPGRLIDLVRTGLIRSIPEEPHGGAYILFADGTVRSNRTTRRLKVFRTK